MERFIQGRISMLGILAALLILLPACGSDSPGDVRVNPGDGDRAGFGGGGIVVVGQDGDDWIVEGTPGRDCIQVGKDCVVLDGTRDRYCDDPDAVVDVVVVNGEVVGGICYPAAEDGEPDLLEPDADGDFRVPGTLNGGVLTFPGDSNGVVLEGDIVLEGQRTTIYGNGMGRTIIDGDLLIRANNARVRGITVLGDVRVETAANNVGLSFLEIHGDLSVESNNATILRTWVFGDATFSGNDAQFLSSRVAGTFTASRPMGLCDGSYYIDIEDEEPSSADGTGETATTDDDELPPWTTPTYAIGDPIICD